MKKEFSIAKLVKKTIEAIKNILFPINCLGCGQDGCFICDNCAETFKLKETQICPFCKTASAYGQTCRDCRSFHALDGVWVASSYHNKLLAKTVKYFKFKFITDLANPLSSLLSNFFQEKILPYSIYKSTFPKSLLSEKKTIITPVPLHKKRENYRGFNQTEIIAKIFTKTFPYEIRCNLKRIRYKKPQVKLSRDERLTNIKDSFVWSGEKPIAKNIILIDDIFTSGATLEECAKTLKDSGAKKVWGLVLARG